MINDNYPKIHFGEDFEERDAFEAAMRGYISHVTIETEEGTHYPVFFYDPIRLKQDLESGLSFGKPCIGEPGLIILPSVTIENIHTAIQYLWKQGYFSHLKPILPNENISKLYAIIDIE